MAKANAVYPKDPEFPELGVDDMTKLAYLHEPGVLLNLMCRYNANEIYVSFSSTTQVLNSSATFQPFFFLFSVHDECRHTQEIY